MSRIDQAHDKIRVLETMCRGITRGFDYHEDEFDKMMTASFWDGLSVFVKSIRYDIDAASDGDHPAELYDYDPEEIEKIAQGNWERSKEKRIPSLEFLRTKEALEAQARQLESNAKSYSDMAEKLRAEARVLDMEEAPTDRIPEGQ